MLDLGLWAFTPVKTRNSLHFPMKKMSSFSYEEAKILSSELRAKLRLGHVKTI